jgi:hypothetical protein
MGIHQNVEKKNPHLLIHNCGKLNGNLWKTCCFVNQKLTQHVEKFKKSTLYIFALYI